MPEITDEHAPERVTEIWVSVGIRLSADGKRCSAWMPPEGESDRDILLYGERAGSYVIGGRYEVTVSRRPVDGRVITTRHSDPKFVGKDHYPDPELKTTWQQWEADSLVAERELSRRGMERKMKQVQALDEALEPLLDIAAKFRTGKDRDAFAAYVLRRIQSSWATNPR